MSSDRRRHQQSSLEFPSIVWPLNRKETGAGYSAVEPFDLGACSHMLPVIRALSDDTPPGKISWQPASIQPDPRSHGIIEEVGKPVVLRPATRIPGFLTESAEPDYREMTLQFEKLHKDLDIPHDLLVGAFKEASGESVGNPTGFTQGNLVACCRPALSTHQPPKDTAVALGSAWPTSAQFQRDVKLGPDDRRGEQGLEYRWSSHREWTLYAGGECGNELWAAPIPAAGDSGEMFPSLRFRSGAGQPASDVDVQASIEFTTPVRQIIARNPHPGFACVRTASMVSLLSITQCYSSSNWTPYIKASIAGCPYSYDDGDPWTCHVSWSPWTLSEAALASGGGYIRLWDFEAGRGSELKTGDGLEDYDIQWNCCEYWNSPRHILCANPDELYFLDARAGSSKTSIMSIPDSAFAFDEEMFTAICPSAMHPMHAVAASTHAIRVFDQRYLKQPVVAWRHNNPLTDPPIHLQSSDLPQYSMGRAAAIVAASEESSQIATFVYGQHSSDGPYISIEQSMLSTSTGTLSIQETVQEGLAIDPMENKDMTIGYSHIPRYSTPHLAGLAFHIMPQGSGNASTATSAVCLVLDDLGTLIGHRLHVMPSADSGIVETPCDVVFRPPMWQSVSMCGQSIIDGMGLSFMDKAKADARREMYWSELRKRSMQYERIDLQRVHRYLVQEMGTAGGASSHASGRKYASGKAADYSRRLQDISASTSKRIARMANSEVSAYDVSSLIISILSSKPANLSKELPTWTADGKRIREAMVSLGPVAVEECWRNGGLPRLLSTVCEQSLCVFPDSATLEASAQGRGDGDSQRIRRGLEDMFASASLPNPLSSATLSRASKDIELAGMRVRLTADKDSGAHGEAAGAAAETPAPRRGISSSPASVLDSKASSLSGPACLLRDLWLNDPFADGSQRQLSLSYGTSTQQPSQPRKRKGRASKPTLQNTQVGLDAQAQPSLQFLAGESFRSSTPGLSYLHRQSAGFEAVPETQFLSAPRQAQLGRSQAASQGSIATDFFSAPSASRPPSSKPRPSRSQGKKKSRKSGF
ncbi:hypothetical protein GQ54DRAFT_204385 [Martensiomyces pterosporus]|nr:hypothetical protein GQ54DRAFT_204385 [Martensiomyces pterosporus]